MIEQWRPVPGYEGSYEASDLGRVRSLPRSIVRSDGQRIFSPGGLLRGSLHPYGYRVVSLRRGRGFKRDATVHQLVLEAFVGPRPEGLWGCHYDDDKTNNRLTNLRWATPSQNQLDAVRNGTHGTGSKTHCKHGHPFDAVNTYRRPSGDRDCRICVARRGRERDARNQAARRAA